MPAVFEALAAPRRREILRFVWHEERTAGEIHRALAHLSFGAVSQHLGILEAAGLVARREEGRFHFYTARRKQLGLLGEWLETMWDEALSELKSQAEADERKSAENPRGRRARGRRRARRKEPAS